MATLVELEMDADARLPPPLAIARVVMHGELQETKDEEEGSEDAASLEASSQEQEAEEGGGGSKCTGVDLRTGGKCGGTECKAKMMKPRKSDAQAEAEYEEEDEAAEERGSFAGLRTPPSRLAASLLMGRDRMARVWREGARRAGIFGGEDEDDEEEETKRGDEDLHAAGGRPSLRRNSVGQQRGSEDNPVAVEASPEDDDANEDNQERTDTPRTICVLPGNVPRLQLSRLLPMTLVPKIAQLWMFLDRIECIAIRDLTYDNEEDGAVYYVLDVYHYQEQHNIPTQRQHRRTNTMTPMSSRRKPAYQLQQRFSSFTKLRSRMLKAACRKHPIIPATADSPATRSSHTQCAYCSRIERFLTSGNESIARLGWKAKMFTTTDMRKALLSDFITELVFLVREQRDACSVLRTLSTYQHAPARHVLRSVPNILKRFLTVQTGETFMR